jgi:triacylglycerol esterase/lipase EstA (alpha/beta hydrolase family)
VHIRRRVGSSVLSAFALGAASVLALGASPATASQPLPVPNEAVINATSAANPNTAPGGANVGCTPTRAHPYPVVLVHGTLSDMYSSFGALSPILANAGYCVYALNYGQTMQNSAIDGLGEIGASAGQLETFVNQVLAETGARKVDIVGWSQGGMMPRYYIDNLGGASKVHILTALSPSNHGTTLDGIATLIGDLGLGSEVNAEESSSCEACVEQEAGSPFLTALNAGGGTERSVKYVVIETEDDEVVTPYTSAFLSGPNVQNILLQNQCPLDQSDHLSIPYDSNAAQDVLNSLGADDPNFQPVCAVVGPLIGDD